MSCLTKHSFPWPNYTPMPVLYFEKRFFSFLHISPVLLLWVLMIVLIQL